MLCSALVLSLFGRDMVLLCDIPLTPSSSPPPASFSFYKRVSGNLLQTKIDERSMLGHIYMSLTNTCSKCSESSMLKGIHVLLPLGSLFLVQPYN